MSDSAKLWLVTSLFGFSGVLLMAFGFGMSVGMECRADTFTVDSVATCEEGYVYRFVGVRTRLTTSKKFNVGDTLELRVKGEK